MSRFKLTVLGFLGFIVMLSVSRVGVAQANSSIPRVTAGFGPQLSPASVIPWAV